MFKLSNSIASLTTEDLAGVVANTASLDGDHQANNEGAPVLTVVDSITEDNKVISATDSPAHKARAEYIEKGWTSPLPLPEGKKFPPAKKTTGNVPESTAEQINKVWAEAESGCNLALRMQSYGQWETLSLDVDQYENKRGRDELKALENELGSLDLDNVPRSTRRGIDSVSAQFFFRVPKGIKWEQSACKDVDVVQMAHRYAAVFPSVVDNMPYRWYLGGEGTEIPKVSDLPELPAEWVEHLKKSDTINFEEQPAQDFNAEESDKWLKSATVNYNGPVGPVFKSILDREDLLLSKGNRHDTMIYEQKHLLQLALFEGEQGLGTALKVLKKAFLEALEGDRGGAEGEWNRGLSGAVNKARGLIEKGNESRPLSVDTAQRFEDVTTIDGAEKAQEAHQDQTDSLLRAAGLSAEELNALSKEEKVALEDNLSRERSRRLAKRIVDAEEQENEKEQYAKPEGIDVAELFETEFPEEQWVVEHLIEDGQQILLYSSAKQGKSYLVQELMSALSTGEPFLGEYSATAPVGNVGLVDVELHPRKLKERLRQREWKNNLKIYSLRGAAPGQDKLMKLNLASEASRREWVTLWKKDNIEYLIVDPLSALIRDAGLDEWREGGLALRYLQQMTAEAGIRAHVVVMHASSKKDGLENGPRGDSAMMDVPDNVWKVVNDKERDTLTITTVGRTEAVGVEATWLDGGRFEFARSFDPFSKAEKAAKASGVDILDIGVNVSRTMYQKAQEKAQAREMPTNFGSTAWCQGKEQMDLWPKNQGEMIDLIRREGGYKEGNKLRLSKAAAEGHLKTLRLTHFTQMGGGPKTWYVPTKPPREVGVEVA